MRNRVVNLVTATGNKQAAAYSTHSASKLRFAGVGHTREEVTSLLHLLLLPL